MQNERCPEGLKSSWKRRSEKTATAAKTAVACFVLTFGLIFTLAGCTDMAQTAAEPTLEDIAAAPWNYTASDVIDLWEPAEIKPEEQTDILIAHGGGELDGFSTSNSAEAVMAAADNGYSLIELDFNMTSDGHVVLVHDWNETTVYYYQTQFESPPDLETFKGMLSYNRFHTMSIDDLVAIFDKCDTFRVVTDAKDANIEVLTAIAEQYPEYLDRFVPQIYGYEQYETVKELGYKDIILTLYVMEVPLRNELAAFYRDNGLFAITISIEKYMDKLAGQLIADGVKGYRHSVSDFEECCRLLDAGCHGVYTSGLLPREFTSQDANYYITMPGPKGTEVKLTDYSIKGDTVADIVARQVHGLQENEYRIYYIGDDGLRMSDQSLDELPYGEVHMPVEIWKVDEEFVGHFTGRTLDYYLWKDDRGVRILDAKFKYRADKLKVVPAFEATLDEALAENPDKKRCREILDGAFIAKAGEYYYYVNGLTGAFMQEDEFFYPMLDVIPEEDITIDEGESSDPAVGVYVPVADAAMAMGASSVKMTDEGDIVISVKRINVTEYKENRDQYPYRRYLKKTLVSGKYLGEIFGRDILEGTGDTKGTLIILPKGTSAGKLADEVKSSLMEAAGRLYSN